MVNIKVDGIGLIKDVNAVFFDKDGTLIDAHKYWHKMISKRAELLRARFDLNQNHLNGMMQAMGIDTHKKCIMPNGPVGIKPRKIVRLAVMEYIKGVGIKCGDDEVEEIFASVDVISESHIGEYVEQIKGAYEIVQCLSNTSCVVVLATTDITKRAHLALRHLGIDAMFDFIIGADMVKRCKPDSEMVDLALEKFRTKRENAIVVGDAVTDIQMGINAGVRASIGVTSGMTNYNDLGKMTKYVIPDVSYLGVS